VDQRQALQMGLEHDGLRGGHDLSCGMHERRILAY
jgi:hypothetical protein